MVRGVMRLVVCVAFTVATASLTGCGDDVKKAEPKTDPNSPQLKQQKAGGPGGEPKPVSAGPKTGNQ
jgi:hypothetical protein